MAKSKSKAFWLLGIHKNNKTYYASGFEDNNDTIATWVVNEKDALQFDSSPFAVEFKNTFFSNREEIFLIKTSQ